MLGIGKGILTLFPKEVWLAIAFGATLMTITILNITCIYSYVCPHLVKPNLEPGQIIIRLLAGITEADDESWFPHFSTGRHVLQ